jgi:hypothetical protein
VSGGSAAGGGFDFQAFVSAYVAAHVLVKRQLRWCELWPAKAPSAVLAETGGPGDDLRVEIGDGLHCIEVQAKRGLAAGDSFREAMLKLAVGVSNDRNVLGALVIDSTSGQTIREFAEDIRRIAQGRVDQLKPVAGDFLVAMKSNNLDPVATTQRLAVITIDPKVDVRYVLEILTQAIGGQDAEHAWSTLKRDALELIASRGRRDSESLWKLLNSEGIDDSNRTPEFRDDWLRVYRGRLSGLYAQWDAELVQLTLSAPYDPKSSPSFDAMYVPLKFSELNPAMAQRQQIQEQAFGVDEILQLQHSVLISGPTGSGKTTWIRWAFRQLLTSERSFPLFIAVRDLVRQWSAAEPGAERSLDVYLQRRFEEHVPAASGISILKLLDGPSAPKPFLLVDGWDEVGQHGEEFRTKLLGLLKENPRLIAVVTSRPYGAQRPSRSEGFSIRHLVGLSDLAISDLTAKFMKLSTGSERAETRTRRFIEELRRSPDRLEMARTPLLLTMMLFLARHHELPRSRHKLYEACVEHLFSTVSIRAIRCCR